MEYSNSTKRVLYLLIIIMAALLGKKMRDYGIYEHLDVKKVCDYTQKRKMQRGNIYI